MRNHIFQHYKFSILLKIMLYRFCLRYQKKYVGGKMKRWRKKAWDEGAMITRKYLCKHFRVKPQSRSSIYTVKFVFASCSRFPPNDTNHKYIMIIFVSFLVSLDLQSHRKSFDDKNEWKKEIWNNNSCFFSPKWQGEERKTFESLDLGFLIKVAAFDDLEGRIFLRLKITWKFNADDPSEKFWIKFSSFWISFNLI